MHADSKPTAEEEGRDPNTARQPPKRCQICGQPWSWYGCTPDQCQESPEVAAKQTDSLFYKNEVRRRAERLRTQLVGQEAKGEAEFEKINAAHAEALKRATFLSTNTAAEWLFGFTSRDLNKLTENEWRQLRYQIAGFAELGPCDFHSALPQGTRTYPWNHYSEPRIRGVASVVSERRPEETIERDRLPSRDTVQVLKAIAARDLQDFSETGGIAPLQLPGTLRLLADKKGGRVIEYFRPDLSEEDTPENAFRFQCQRLFPIIAHRVRTCPECRSLFLHGRSDQKFCGDTCRTRFDTRRLRNTPSDRIGKRGRPRKAVRAKQRTGTNSRKRAGTKSAAIIRKAGR